MSQRATVRALESAPAWLRHGEVAVTLTAAAVVALLAVFVVWPIVRVATLSVSGPAGLTIANYAEFFGTRRLARILVQSLAVAAVSTVLTVTVALVLAYAVTRTDIPGKRFVSLASLLPLIAPPFLVSLAFILLFGRTGVVTRALGIDGSIYGFHGIVVSQVYFFINGMVTVSAVIFLIYPGFNLGSVAILAQVENGDPGVACALGTILLAIVVAAVLLVRSLVGGDRVAVLKL